MISKIKSKMHALILVSFSVIMILADLACANRHSSDNLALLLLSLPPTRKILVLGDSLTEYSNGFYLQEYLGSDYIVETRGAPNKDIPYWSMRIPEALGTSGNAFNRIIFPMGTNDAYAYTSPVFIKQLSDFHTDLRKYSSAPIFYCKMPRTKDPALISKILENNDLIEKNLPNDSTALIDLDLEFESYSGSELLYPLNDPVHPNQSGYRLIGRIMQKSILTTSF